MKNQLGSAPWVEHPEFSDIEAIRWLECNHRQLDDPIQLQCSFLDTQAIIAPEMERGRYFATLDPITVPFQ